MVASYTQEQKEEEKEEEKQEEEDPKNPEPRHLTLPYPPPYFHADVHSRGGNPSFSPS